MEFVEVDQSTKVEQSGPTVLAFANSITHAIVIPSSVKQEIFQRLRKRGKVKVIAQLLLFSAGLYLLLKDHIAQIDCVVIDREYSGHEHDIKFFLLQNFRRMGQEVASHKIRFALVGRKSAAHHKANSVHSGKDRDFTRVTLEEIIVLLK
ncbi:MAG: hypothetical protein KF893_23770 [Caldilineaceae bacterium]|nr:hypothetical protein [Caldilineaceae bacterium]